MSDLKIKLKRSLNGCLPNQKATARSFGLRTIDDITIQPDNEATCGKLRIISHLVQVDKAD